MPSNPQVVVITGASAGVGRATVRAFARRGAHIGLMARGSDGLDAAQREVEEAGGKAVAVVTDVANADDVDRGAGQIEAALGPIDIWVNNAMTSVFSRFVDMTADEFHRVTEVTYLGYVYGTMAALRRMRPRNRGVIVQVGSALAYRGIPLQSAYCGAKHAIQGFTEALRCELMHDRVGVHITMVHLPAMNTPQFGWVKSRLPRKAQPVPPIYQPELAAEAIVWAAHHRRREINVGGVTSAVIAANKMAPYLGDVYLAKTGFDSQMTDEPLDPDQPNNLWEPVPGDHGAHGAFDRRAHNSSIQLWLTTHRRLLGTIGGGLAALVGLALAGGRSRNHNKQPETTAGDRSLHLLRYHAEKQCSNA